VTIFVDADGCPVKNEIYRVARRHQAPVVVVSNKTLRVPESDSITMQIVEGNFDAADDWIAARAGQGDLVITADIPLAARCLKNGAVVLDHRGGEFTDDMVGQALAGRELMSHVRAMGGLTGGPSAFEARDRSRFLHRLDESLRRLARPGPGSRR
jgi:uncharacterized protein YaiI (UPF0178 family)